MNRQSPALTSRGVMDERVSIAAMNAVSSLELRNSAYFEVSAHRALGGCVATWRYSAWELFVYVVANGVATVAMTSGRVCNLIVLERRGYLYNMEKSNWRCQRRRTIYNKMQGRRKRERKKSRSSTANQFVYAGNPASLLYTTYTLIDIDRQIYIGNIYTHIHCRKT